jgi:hypothetical protein
MTPAPWRRKSSFPSLAAPAGAAYSSTATAGINIALDLAQCAIQQGANMAETIKSYDAAIRGTFFDIARVADGADDIARHARYLADGLLFIENGTIQTLLP